MQIHRYPIDIRKFGTLACTRGIKVTWFAKLTIAPV